MEKEIYLYIGGELRGLFDGVGNIREVLGDEDIDACKEELMACRGIIILADTEDVFPAYLTNEQLPAGLYIAQQLRLKDIKAPILFTSYLSRAELHDHQPDREILMAIGHDYIQRPVKDPHTFTGLLAAM